MISVLQNTARPYLLNLSFRYDPHIIPIVKAIPGAAWVPEKKVWSIPGEFLPSLKAALPNEEFQAGPQSSLTFYIRQPTQFGAGYQETAVTKACADPTGFVFNFKPGDGKTAALIETLRLQQVRRAIIVCPAMVRRTWLEQFARWWPETTANTEDPDIFLLTEGARKSNSKAARGTLQRLHERLGQDPSSVSSRAFIVTSYGLLSKLSETLPAVFNPAALVFDEIHYLQEPRTKQFKEAQTLISRYPKAKRYGLTGTLFTNGIINAWGPLSTIYPGRYGSKHSFGARYTQANHNGYGWEYPGVEEAFLPELKWRLSLVSYRPTDEEINASGRKPPQLSIEEIDEDDSFDIKAWSAHYLAAGDSRIAVLTYNRDKAHRLAELLAGEANVVTITGEESPEKRGLALEEMLKSPRPAIVVATISSIKIGINAFANFPLVLLTDLSDNLEEMVQALHRFKRKGSSLSRVRGYMLTNNITRPKALRLKRKVDAIAAVMDLGGSEQAMQEAFGKQNEFSPEEWQAAIMEVLGSKTADDGSE